MKTNSLKNAGQLKSDTFNDNSSLYGIKKNGEGPCCDGWADACKDLAKKEADATAKITGFTYEGKTYTHADGFDSTDLIGAYNFIADVIASNEINPIINVSYVDGEYNVSHIGVGKLETVVIDGGDVATDRLCKTVQYCEWIFSVSDTPDGDKPYVYVDGVKTELANSVVYNNDGDAAAAIENQATADQIKTDIEDLFGAGSVLDVKPNADCRCFYVTAKIDPSTGNYGSGASQNGECYTSFE